MSIKTLKIDPVTRIEGHLGIEVKIDEGKVIEARAQAMLYRGFEKIMVGRNPKEAQDLPTRICGVCPCVHSVCGNKNLEMAFGVTYNENCRKMRNMLAPFIPRYKGDYRLPKKVNDLVVQHYVQALDIRRMAQEATAIWAGKIPHAISLVPGGISETPTKEKIELYKKYVKEMKEFVEEIYVPDVMAVADYYLDWFAIGGRLNNFLSFGVFEMDNTDQNHFIKRGVLIDDSPGDMNQKQISEDVKNSWQEGMECYHPLEDDTKSGNPDKEGGYSFMTAPRYKGKPMEVGPLARMLVNGNLDKKPSVMSRHLARAVETRLLVNTLDEWVDELEPGKTGMVEVEMPERAFSYGLSEAPRGACGHWMKIEDHKISHWQAIPSTNWNCSPRDADDVPGPCEQALVGTPVADPENPIEIMRVVRSYDPCIGCAVHVITPGRDLGEFKVAGF
jgi:hydrogenase large subunit